MEAGADVHAPAAQQDQLPSMIYSAASSGAYDMV